MGGQALEDRLINELTNIVNTYKPDIIGLAEVVKSSPSNKSSILETLSSLGYHCHFTVASPKSDKYLYGTAFCTKNEPVSINELELGPDLPAIKRGYPGYRRKVISAEYRLSDKQNLRIITAHMLPLDYYSLISHHRDVCKLESFIRSGDVTNTIAIGDFNEPAHLMPLSFKNKVKDIMNRKTGTLLNPTWRFGARRYALIKANADHLYYPKNCPLKLAEFKTMECKCSDHCPIFAVFEDKNYCTNKL
jgi:endonuclease/exonuclease/phosphatase family metal-dependent hydrolase